MPDGISMCLIGNAGENGGESRGGFWYRAKNVGDPFQAWVLPSANDMVNINLSRSGQVLTHLLKNPWFLGLLGTFLESIGFTCDLFARTKQTLATGSTAQALLFKPELNCVIVISDLTRLSNESAMVQASNVYLIQPT
jgi:hypothetical protein